MQPSMLVTEFELLMPLPVCFASRTVFFLSLIYRTSRAKYTRNACLGIQRMLCKYFCIRNRFADMQTHGQWCLKQYPPRGDGKYIPRRAKCFPLRDWNPEGTFGSRNLHKFRNFGKLKNKKGSKYQGITVKRAFRLRIFIP